MKTKIFKNSKLEFLELRYVENITQCQKMHLHEEVTITALKEGSLNISFNEASFILNPFFLVFINSFIAHCATLNSKVAKGGYVLYIKKQYLNLLNITFEKEYYFKQDLQNKFITLCELLLNKKVSILEKEEHFLEFCFEFFSFKDKFEKKEQTLSLKIKSYLDVNFLEELSLEEIAKSFDLSVVHLIRVFKKEFKIPIHSYILNKKVHLAKELLSSKLPISQIAQECGFFDQSHFNRSFKRVFQLTPKEFQKNIFS
ncbi:AraC family transcriptional regulator [Malaciobacter mytili LMG 24559]|uniref:AraC family transcriptional regulator n=1 Tax=Malaciobacter mytili LMG 24559 TaxID=1032238 RepID=A0AAX2AIU5_9BACT|nr:AraC family transcriptional regulator [Malaciobacter mytili]AXH14628.1 transcriptional regulator, AraC family [Malaciobacter mytili LMG 24559]RXK16679.1 AraC family transcriptional regulator [Malaciobacter mytili LMG 24559]